MLATHLPGDWRVKQFGIDTLVVGFKPTTAWACAALRRPVTYSDDLAALTGKPCTTDETGRPLPVAVSDKGNWTARFQWATVLGFPEWGLVRVECRPAALFAKNTRATGLIRPSQIIKAEAAMRSLAESVLGARPFDVSGEPRIHRADLAVDAIHDGALDIGRNALFAAAQVALPYWGPGRQHPQPGEAYLQGVSWASRSNQIQFRIYDKPLELSKRKHAIKRGTTTCPHPDAGDAGRWLRLERQFRPTSAEKRPTAAELTAADLSALWLGQWASWLRTGNRHLLVCGRRAAHAEIAAQFGRDAITKGRATALIAAVSAWEDSLPPALHYGSSKDAAGQLRRIGVAFAPQLPADVRFNVGGLIGLGTDAWRKSPSSSRTR